MMEWLPRGLPSIHAPIPICVPPKAGQKRPATSPAPHIPVPHHLQTPPGGGGGGLPGSSVANSPVPTSAGGNALMNHALPSNHIGTPSPSQHQQHQQHQQQQQQQHQAQQQAVAAAVQQQLAAGVGLPPGAIGAASASSRGSFAAALRTLAKQADNKEEEVAGDRSGVPTSGAGGPPPPSSSSNQGGLNSVANRVGSERPGEDRVSSNKKRSPPSPQPPEKIARLSHTPQTASLQPELLARSGFQPYRSDERLMHPAGAFPLEAYSHFAGLPGIPPAAFLNPAGLPYTEQLYLEHRYQLFRAAGAHPSHPHAAALYPQMASPYSHLYSMMPGAALGISPAMHDRMKLEEEHRARLAREEEREREMQREKERELREQREKEQREKEQREKEQREREQREKEQREKEARERKLRDEERERERERQLLNASHHYSNQLYSPLNRNLLGSMIPHLNMSLRGPPGALHGLPGMSHYHAAAANAQRQSPHGAMGLNLGMAGLPGVGVPPLGGHGPNLQHHLQQAAMGLAHPGAAGLTHPGFSAAALGLSAHPHSLNLSHPHMSPHHPASLAHQLPPHTSSAGGGGLSNSIPVTASSSLSASSPHSSLNLTAAVKLSADQVPTSTPSGGVSGSGLPPTTSSSHIPNMGHYYHHGHLAAMHAAAAAASGMTPTAAHQQQPLSLPSSPKITPPITPSSSANGGRAGGSPHAMRHHIAAAVAAAAQQSALIDKAATPVNHEPTTLDLTGSNSNSSNQAPSNASSGQPANHEINGAESNGASQGESKEQVAAIKEDPLKSSPPPVALEKKPATPNAAVDKPIHPDSSPENISRRSASPPTETNNSMPAVVGTAVASGKCKEENPKILDTDTTAATKTEIEEEKLRNARLSVSPAPAPLAAPPKNLSASPDTVSTSGGVTSTTSGTTPPPVVSSSTSGAATKAAILTSDEVSTSAATPAGEATR
ncbi:AF4/FMR2 family member lilli isoform X4 [Drosophila ficusphila]|uniref:AF4/FMR2 family member lilli isoform X4 n=1 Tax=Drosophila ficusphila TaxID=30025 RepID=UPI0007E73DB2|nr:AF4/FMR2 family member lilli isoform X4 [Drosophila ficusphila]